MEQKNSLYMFFYLLLIIINCTLYHTSKTFLYNLLFNEWNFAYEISSILNANISDPLSFIHIQYEHENAHDSSGYLYLILRYILFLR